MFQTSVEKMKLLLLTFNMHLVKTSRKLHVQCYKKGQIFMLIMFKVYNIDINGGRSVVVIFALQHIFFF